MSETHTTDSVRLSKADRYSIEALFQATADTFECELADVIPPDLYGLVEAIMRQQMAQAWQEGLEAGWDEPTGYYQGTHRNPYTRDATERTQ